MDTVNVGGLDLLPLILTIIAIAGAVALAMVPLLIKKLMDKLRIDREGVLGKMLEGVIESGINLAINKAKTLATGRVKTIQLDNPLLNSVAGYVSKSAPEALKQFGITEERLQEIITARLIKNPDVATPYTPSTAAVAVAETDS